MIGGSTLKLYPYKGKELTENEIILEKFFERRHEEHTKQLEKKQRKSSFLANDFIQESGREGPLKAKVAPLSPKSVPSKREQEILLQEKKGILSNALRDDQLMNSAAEIKMKGSVHDNKIPRKSRYHIASQQKQTLDDEVDTSENTVGSIEPSVEVSKLIGKRPRDTSVINTEQITPLALPPDQLDPVKFPLHQMLLTKNWSPLLACSEDDNDIERLQQQINDADGEVGSREFILKDFSLLKNQTLAFKITVPPDSARWAVNIGPADPSKLLSEQEEGNISHSLEPCDHWQQILFHFNPRYDRRKEIVQDSMQDGQWTFCLRQADMKKMKEAFPMKNFTLIIQIRENGFFTSVNGVFLSMFPHRSNISEFKHLRLQLPIVSDNGNPENAIFHKVWWGRRDPSNNLDFIGCSREAIDDHLRITKELAKKVFIGGLPYTNNFEKLDDLRSFLLDIFDEYGPDPESLELPPNKGFALVKLSSADNTEAAIAAYNGYHVENEDDPNDEFHLVVSHAR